MRGIGKTPLQFQRNAVYQQFARSLSLLDKFDAISLSILLRLPYGTVTRLLTPLKAAGYIAEIGRVRYSHLELDKNPAFRNWRLNCQDAVTTTTPLLTKTPTFTEYLAQYTAFWTENEKKMARPIESGKIRGDGVGSANQGEEDVEVTG